MRRARGWGIEHIVLHAGVEDLEDLQLEHLAHDLDCLVVPVQPGPGGAVLQEGTKTIRECKEAGLEVVANTVLSTTALPQLAAIARSLARVRPDRIALTYPFPISGGASTEVARIPAVVRALGKVLPVFKAAGIGVSIKGIPACYLPLHRSCFRKSANRWYVDADHQLDEALMFYPDVVAFTKGEVCRFCSADGACDGFFATYLRRDGFPALKALSSAQ